MGQLVPLRRDVDIARVFKKAEKEYEESTGGELYKLTHIAAVDPYSFKAAWFQPLILSSEEIGFKVSLL
jgi:hypothetical protein